MGDIPLPGEETQPQSRWRVLISLTVTLVSINLDRDRTVVITGGFYTMRTVTEYSEGGRYDVFPELRTGRWGHGCSSYVSNNNMQVTTL